MNIVVCFNVWCDDKTFVAGDIQELAERVVALIAERIPPGLVCHSNQAPR